jgi:serine/threonine protein kinase
MGQNLVTLCPADFYEEKGFDDTYEIDEANFLGTGKFAVVHLCWRRNQPEKRYALKVINTKIGDMASINRIHEEINILQVLGQHPGLVSLIDVDEGMPGSIRLVLELCEGGELYDRIQQLQYYPENEAKICCHNLLDACAYIHGKGIMHRDLKPENILLASKVSHTDVKISDFGLARMSRDFPHRLPRSHSICGSDFYLAPEVIKQEEYGREIDIWAVGIITYVLLSGSLPFFHNVLHKLYRQIVERDMSFPEQAWKNVSKGALDFILRLLQVRAGDRLTAEQALSHPWLRSATTGSSFGSFENQQVARIDSHSHYTPHALEHAHNVGSKGQERPGTPTGRMQGGASPYGQQNPYGPGAMPAMGSRGAVQGPPPAMQSGGYRGGY